MEAKKVLNALERGANTPQEIAEEVGVDDEEHVVLALDMLDDIGAVSKSNGATKSGLDVKYEVKNERIFSGLGSVRDGKSLQDLNQKMPVNRDYNWDSMVPNEDELVDFYPRNDVKKKIMAEINRRGESNAREPVFWLTGPVGCGKTLLAKTIAAELDATFLTIQGKYSMSSSAIVGSPMLVGDNSVWVDGPGTKAVLSSQEQTTVLLLDECNRARPEAKEALYSLLDNRNRIIIEKRGGEVIVGDPSNLIIFVTTNEGEGNIVQKLDSAEIRRYGNKHEIDYLGYVSDNDKRDLTNHEGKPENFKRAAELITEQSGSPLKLSKDIIAVANDIRSEARETGGEVRTDIPTSALINWAQTALSYWEGDIDDPIVEAGFDAVATPFYYGDEEAMNYVERTISSAFTQAPISDDEYVEWAQKDMNEFIDT